MHFEKKIDIFLSNLLSIKGHLELERVILVPVSLPQASAECRALFKISFLKLRVL